MIDRTTFCIIYSNYLAFIADDKLNYPLGDQNSIQWKFDPGRDLPTLVYSEGGRKLVVTLFCQETSGDDVLDVYGEDQSPGTYNMKLTSKCACWDGCKGISMNGHVTGQRLNLLLILGGVKPGSNPSGLSGGAVFIIILVSLVAVYLIVFAASNKFIKKSTGWDIFPHRTFWLSVSIYAVSGVRFVFRRPGGGKTDYASV